MVDRTGKDLHVGDRVRWGSGPDLTYGVVRSIRPSASKTGAEECVADNGNPTNNDIATNGWSVLACLESKQVTFVQVAMPGEEKERRDRAELARLLRLYPPDGTP